MTLADNLLQLLPDVPDLLLHHGTGHGAVGETSGPDVLGIVPQGEMLLRKGRDLLLVLPDEVGDVAHGDGEQRPSGDGAKGQRGGRAQDDAAVPGDNGAGHGGDDNVGAAGEETLAGLRGGSQGGDGVGEGVLDVEGTGEDVVEAGLGGEGVLVEEDTGLTDLGGQDVGGGGSGGRGSGNGGLGRELDGEGGLLGGVDGSGDGGDDVRKIIVDGFPLVCMSRAALKSWRNLRVTVPGPGALRQKRCAGDRGRHHRPGGWRRGG